MNNTLCVHKAKIADFSISKGTGIGEMMNLCFGDFTKVSGLVTSFDADVTKIR